MPESFYRRNLPHWDVSGATYFVTMCLAGSAPARGWLSTRRTETRPRLGDLARPAIAPTSTPGHIFVAFDKHLDTKSPVRWFADRRLAAIAADAIQWGAGHRYDLIAYAVMPSHVHWVFTPTLPDLEPGRLARLTITAGFKRHTAINCNRLLNRQGRFWQAESFDHVVRSDAELERIVRYVEHNPVRAGLCERAEDWEFSSAHRGRE